MKPIAFLPILFLLFFASGCSDGVSDEDVIAVYVADSASILSYSTEAHLNLMGRSLEMTHGCQVMTMTIFSLNGQNLEQYANTVFNTYGFGRAGFDDGVFLLIVSNDRKVRIEVGAGLEHLLTNELCADIIRDDIVPYFTEGDYDKGTITGYRKIIQTIVSDPDYIGVH